MTANQSFEPSRQRGAAQFHRQAARCMSEVDTLYPRILERFRSRIRERRYVVTLDALDEIDEDPLSVFDVERGFSLEKSYSGNAIKQLGNGSTWSEGMPSIGAR